MGVDVLERLFTLTPRDAQSALWGPRYTRITRANTATTVVVGSDTTVPWPQLDQGKVEWPQNIHVTANPGAGQLCSRMALAMTFGVGVGQQVELGSVEGGAADEILSLIINPGIALVGGPRGHLLVASATFDSGVAANDVTINCSSIVTVRGNMAVF